jgi:uncharacterized protein YjbI with pentapeptide repeats
MKEDAMRTGYLGLRPTRDAWSLEYQSRGGYSHMHNYYIDRYDGDEVVVYNDPVTALRNNGPFLGLVTASGRITDAGCGEVWWAEEVQLQGLALPADGPPFRVWRSMLPDWVVYNVHVYDSYWTMCPEFREELEDVRLNARYVSFRYHSLVGVWFYEADLEGADFHNLDLRASDLSRCYLWGADFERASLGSAKLRDAVVGAANFSAASLRGANCESIGAPLEFPPSFRGANLCGANLRGAKIPGADFEGADLRGAYLYLADLRCADLRGADLRGAYMAKAQLQGADLSGADLRGAVLTDVDLVGVDTSDARLDGAVVSQEVPA